MSANVSSVLRPEYRQQFALRNTDGDFRGIRRASLKAFR